MNAPIFDPRHVAASGGGGCCYPSSSSAPWPLAMVEVTPLMLAAPSGTAAAPPLSAPMVKLQLRRMCVDAELGTPGAEMVRLVVDSNASGDHHRADDGDAPASEDEDGVAASRSEKTDSAPAATPVTVGAVRSVPARRTVLGGSLYVNRSAGVHCQVQRPAGIDTCCPVMYLRSDDPLDVSVEGVPCRVRGYAPAVVPLRERGSNETVRSGGGAGFVVDATVTDGTLIRILPPAHASWTRPPSEEGDAEGDDDATSWAAITDPDESSSFLTVLSGEVPLPSNASTASDPSHESILAAHDPDAVRALSLRLDGLLSRRPVMIGTTPDAVRRQREGISRRRRRREAIGRFIAAKTTSGDSKYGADSCGKATTPQGSSAERTSPGPDAAAGGGTNAEPSSSVFSSVTAGGGGLVVHSSHSGHGKTLLVSAVAQKLLEQRGDGSNNGRIHVINAPSLFARYGAGGADAALESLLHGIAMSAAVRPRPQSMHDGGGDGDSNDNAAEEEVEGGIGSMCVILDGLDAFVPPGLSGGLRSAGDPALPALNSIAAYLSRLSHALSSPSLSEFPFPSRNPMYNLTSGTSGGTAGGGYVLPVRFALVGVVTVDDDGGRKRSVSSSGGSNSSSGASTTVLDALGNGARFRLPTPSSSTRLAALRRALDSEGVELDDEARGKLPEMAAGAVELRGDTFGKAAGHLGRMVMPHVGGHSGSGRATVRHVKAALAAALGGGIPAAAEVTFASPPSNDGTPTPGPSSSGGSVAGLFASVGGNTPAKTALRDALALDPRTRLALAAFGRSAPTGVLLYGPPGTGKTLLAKAAAMAMRQESGAGTAGGGLGGAFISLRADDVVRSEVGNSEKAVASAFETARRNAPSVVFIDEFQALFTERGKGSGRLASTLLECMDDVARWRDADATAAAKGSSEDGSGAGGDRISSTRVVVLGATNAPWMIDRAFLRPGRFDRTVHVGLPDLDERESILMVHIARMKLHEDVRTPEALRRLCRELAVSTEGFSGADLAAVCRAAAARCLSEDDDAASGEEGVAEGHFMEARAEDVGKSSSAELVRRIAKWRPNKASD